MITGDRGGDHGGDHEGDHHNDHPVITLVFFDFSRNTSPAMVPGPWSVVLGREFLVRGLCRRTLLIATHKTPRTLGKG